MPSPLLPLPPPLGLPPGIHLLRRRAPCERVEAVDRPHDADQRLLSGIVGIDRESMVLDVLPGTFGTWLEDTLRDEHGVTVGHWPQSIDLSTVGGWLACRGAGQLSTRYGKIEDMVVGMDVVLADGRAITTDEAHDRMRQTLGEEQAVHRQEHADQQARELALQRDRGCRDHDGLAGSEPLRCVDRDGHELAAG